MDKTYMKIYLDNGFAELHGGGIGVYSNLLYSGLKKRGCDVTLGSYPFLIKLKNRLLRRALYTFYLSFILPFHLKINKYQVAHLTNSQVPVIKNSMTKYISTIHDINPILFPETVPSIYSYYFKLILKNAFRCSDCIITVSQSVKKELHYYFNLPETKVKVCQIGINNGFEKKGLSQSVLGKYSLKTKEYFLFVGRLEKRKNLIVLIKAFEKFKNETKSKNRLVLVGTDGNGVEEIVDAVNASKYRDDIIRTGYVEDKDLKEIYANSIAFVFPSIYEGFGIPLLEAMKFKLPIILSRIPTNLEMLDSRGFFFDSQNVDELKNLLKRFEDEKDQAIDYSDILNNYSLNNMIELHLDVYKSALQA